MSNLPDMVKRLAIFLLLALGAGLAWKAIGPAATPEASGLSKARATSRQTNAFPSTPPRRAPETAGAKLARVLSSEIEDEAHKLSAAELGDFLNQSQYSPDSMVAAFEASRDKEFLKLAAQAYPHDPLVQAKVLMHDVFPEDRAKWIGAMKQSDPGNSFPNFLAAADLMKTGDTKGALAEISAAASKQFNDYARESAAGLEEAYLTAGRNPAEAKAFGASEVLLPHLAPIKQAASQMADRATELRQAGDVQGQVELLLGAWELGQQFRDSSERGGMILMDLVGVAMENMALSRWPEEATAPFGNPKELLEHNKAYRAEVGGMNELVNAWMSQAPPDNELIMYYDRMRMHGEWDAMKWLRNRKPELAPVAAP